jgi:hypothetical protein
MPPPPAHQRKARHNEKFFKSVVTAQSSAKTYPDWCITIIYYVALQYVDAKLAKMDMHPPNHYTRNPMVANNLRKMSGSFFFLQNRSEEARYFPDTESKFNHGDIRACVDKLNQIEPRNGLEMYSSSKKTPFS